MSEPFNHLKAALADRYVLERELGTGGMATVFLAHDPRHNPYLPTAVPPYRPTGGFYERCCLSPNSFM